MAVRGMRALQQWCKVQTAGYQNVAVRDMSSSWRDGLAFCAIIHKYRPDLIDFDSLSKENVYDNNKLAFDIAESELGIPALLEASDMVALKVPDKLSVMTYVAQYYDYFKGRKPGGGPGIKSPRSTKRQTPPTSPTPQAKKFLLYDEDDNPKKSKEKTGTISDRCAVCKDKVYLLERHIQDGKSYHRSCFRRINLTSNKPYSSVLQSPIESKPSKSADSKNSKEHLIKSPTSENRVKFFSENRENKDCDVTTPGWVREDKNRAKLAPPRPPSPPKCENLETDKVELKKDKVGPKVSGNISNEVEERLAKLRNKRFEDKAKRAEVLKSARERLAELEKQRNQVESESKKLRQENAANIDFSTSKSKQPSGKENTEKEINSNERPMDTDEIVNRLPQRKERNRDNVKKNVLLSSSDNEITGDKTSHLMYNEGMSEIAKNKVTSAHKKTKDVKVSDIQENSVTEPKAPPRRKRSEDNSTNDLSQDSFTYGFGLSALRRKKPDKAREETVVKSKSVHEEVDDEFNTDSLDRLVAKNRRYSREDQTLTVSNIKKKGDIKPFSKVVAEVVPESTEIEKKVDSKEFDRKVQYHPSQKKFIRKEVPMLDVSSLFEKKFGRSLEDLSNISDNDLEEPITKVNKTQNGKGKPENKKAAKEQNSPSETIPDNKERKTKKDHLKEDRKLKAKSASIDNIGETVQKDNVCVVCHDKVFRLERKIDNDDKVYHKSCFKKVDAERDEFTIEIKSPKKSKGKTEIVVTEDKQTVEEEKRKKEGRFKKRKQPEYVMKKALSKSMEDLSASASEAIETKQPKQGILGKLFKSPDKKKLPDKKANRASASIVEMESESKEQTQPVRKRALSEPDWLENERTNFKVDMKALREKFGGAENEFDENRSNLKSQINKPWSKSNPDVRFASDDDYKKLKDAQLTLAKTKDKTGPKQTAKDVPKKKGKKNKKNKDDNGNNEVKKGLKQEPKKKDITNTEKKVDEVKDQKTEWQLEAERRAQLRSGSYTDPEDAKAHKAGETEDVFAETPVPVTRFKKPVTKKDMEVKIIPATPVREKSGPKWSTPKAFRPLLHSSPAESSDLDSPKKHYAPMPPAQRRTISAEGRLDANMIQKELEELDKKQTELEKKGREMENSLRSSIDKEDDTLLVEWFSLVNEKNKMVRRESEIMYISKAQQLEDEHADLEYELRTLLAKPESRKTASEKEREDYLLDRIIDLVDERSRIVDTLDDDRIREAEEDRDIEDAIALSVSHTDEKEEETKVRKKIKKGKKDKEKHKSTFYD